jgi:hypothetical protein
MTDHRLRRAALAAAVAFAALCILSAVPFPSPKGTAAEKSGSLDCQVRPDFDEHDRQWVADRPTFLRTAGAGLKAGGRLVIIEPETEGDDPELNLLGPYGFPTRAGYLEMFRRAGFELVSAEKKPS